MTNNLIVGYAIAMAILGIILTMIDQKRLTVADVLICVVFGWALAPIYLVTEFALPWIKRCPEYVLWKKKQ